MPDVYIAPEPHRCPVSDFFWEMEHLRKRPGGSVWRCDCGRYWVNNIPWVPVRWWNFTARRRIREAVSGA